MVVNLKNTNTRYFLDRLCMDKFMSYILKSQFNLIQDAYLKFCSRDKLARDNGKIHR